MTPVPRCPCQASRTMLTPRTLCYAPHRRGSGGSRRAQGTCLRGPRGPGGQLIGVTVLGLRLHPDLSPSPCAFPTGCRRPPRAPRASALAGGELPGCLCPPHSILPGPLLLLRREQTSYCSLFSPRCRNCRWHSCPCTKLATLNSSARARPPARAHSRPDSLASCT